MREESQENQNGTKNTNRENRRIASLAVWSFGGAQFSTFLDGNNLQDDGTEVKPVFDWISLSQKDVFSKKEKISSSSPSSRVVQYSDKFMHSIVLYYIHITID